METAEAYKSRLSSYLGGKDPIAVLRETPQEIADLIRGVPRERLTQQPGPGKWSVSEIVGHLLDDEVATAWRYRQMLAQDGARLDGFDQEEWARLGGYAEADATESLSLFRAIREWNLRMLASLTPEEWNHGGIHEERGATTVRDLAHHMAAHDLNHLLQIRNILV